MSWNSTAHPRRWRDIIKSLLLPQASRPARRRNDSLRGWARNDRASNQHTSLRERYSRRRPSQMRSKVLAAVVLAIGMVSVSVPLFAHHGTAAFENDKKVTLKGTVTEWLWSNPHCLLQFHVKGDDGKVVHW